MTKYCFLNMVLTDSDRRLYEVVDFNTDSFLEYKVVYVDITGLTKFAEDKSYEKDFSIENGYLVWDGREASIPPAVYNRSLNNYISISTSNIHIYKKLADLVSMEARYISSAGVQSMEETGSLPLLGVSSLSNCKISQSTMRVYLSLKTEDGWRTRTLIGNDKGLQLHPFYVIIEKRNVSQDLLCEGISHVKDLELDSGEISLFKIEDGISLYPNFHPSFSFQPALINNKTLQAAKNKCSIDLMDTFIQILENTLFGYKEEETKSEYRGTGESDKSGVFFRFKSKAMNFYKRKELINRAIDLYSQYASGAITVSTMMATLRNTNSNYLENYGTLSIITMLSNTASDPLDRLDGARSSRYDLKCKSLYLELELFSMRAHMYMTDFSLPEYGNLWIATGGKSEYETVIEKVGGGLAL